MLHSLPSINGQWCVTWSTGGACACIIHESGPVEVVSELDVLQLFLTIGRQVSVVCHPLGLLAVCRLNSAT